MEISYRLTDRSRLAGWEYSHNVAVANNKDLLWSFFPGDISISDEGDAIETRFEWVPLLHFGLSMVSICEGLAGCENLLLKYVFTEADESLTFQRQNSSVLIEASFDSARIACPLKDLGGAVVKFVTKLVAGIGSRYPAFLETALAEEMLSRATELAR